MLVYHACLERRADHFKYDFIYKKEDHISSGKDLDRLREIADVTIGTINDVKLDWAITSLTLVGKE